MTVIGHGYDDNVGAPAFRNVIINGGMSVAQRATSVASITSGAGAYNTADRWNIDLSAAGTWTQSVENDAPTGSGHRKSLKMLCTTANASLASGAYNSVITRLEGQNVQHFAKGTSSAKAYTLSFWVKSNVTGTYAAFIFDNDNSRSATLNYTISASGVWEKKTLTFNADTTGVLDNDNAYSLGVYFSLAMGSNFTTGTPSASWGAYSLAIQAAGQTANVASAVNNYWQITGVQLEAGSVATPFEFEPFETTLRKCLRYYQKSTIPIRAIPRYSDGIALSHVSFSVWMRNAPVVTITNVTGVNNCDLAGIEGFKTYSNGAHTNNEGSYNWTASAEL